MNGGRIVPIVPTVVSKVVETPLGIAASVGKAVTESAVDVGKAATESSDPYHLLNHEQREGITLAAGRAVKKMARKMQGGIKEHTHYSEPMETGVFDLREVFPSLPVDDSIAEIKVFYTIVGGDGYYNDGTTPPSARLYHHALHGGDMWYTHRVRSGQTMCFTYHKALDLNRDIGTSFISSSHPYITGGILKELK